VLYHASLLETLGAAITEVPAPVDDFTTAGGLTGINKYNRLAPALFISHYFKTCNGAFELKGYKIGGIKASEISRLKYSSYFTGRIGIRRS